MGDDLEELRAWFRTWGEKVASVDYAGARPLFDDAVVSFGTFAAFVSGIDHLQENQWERIWPKISGFEFLVDDLAGAIQGDAAWAAVRWTSCGYHEDGTPFDRPGRATVTFRRQGGEWRATHTHFSLEPGVPAQTYGAKAG